MNGSALNVRRERSRHKARPQAGSVAGFAEPAPASARQLTARELKERFFGVPRERSGEEFAAFMRS